MAGTLARLKRRADFLKVASAGRKWVAPGLIVQARRRPGEEQPGQGRAGKRGDGKGVDPSSVRVGFTVSSKVGNAVARNRARRRLRALLASVAEGRVTGGVDLVLIGRTETLVRPFPDLVRDLAEALKRLGVWEESAPLAANKGQTRSR